MTLGATTTYLSARFLSPDLIERGAAQKLKCPLYQDGALVAPTSGTISIYNASNVAIVDGQAVTVSGSIAEYDLAGATTTDEQLGEGWRVEWSLLVSGTTFGFRNTGALVRFSLWPTLTEADLTRRVSSLDITSPTCIHSGAAGWSQDARDEAWAEIQLKLINVGRRPNLILDSTALRGLHLNLSLAFIFEDFSTRLNEAFREHADHYRREYREAWNDLRLDYDTDDSGTNSTSQQSAAVPTVWLNGRW